MALTTNEIVVTLPILVGNIVQPSIIQTEISLSTLGQIFNLVGELLELMGMIQYSLSGIAERRAGILTSSISLLSTP